MQDAYQDDLAYIHDVGFGHLARSAAAIIVEQLGQQGIHEGIVVDLGCGSGITARVLCDAGFTVIGIDLSEALIKIAQRRVPEAEFQVGSFVTAQIPPCVAVMAVGEVFSYSFDEANSNAARAALLSRIYAALMPGGLLLFDMAGPDRAPLISPQRTFMEGSDWAVLVEAEVDHKLLTRRVTTFRKQGELYRRNVEVHQQHLIDSNDILKLLQQVGFSVQAFESYGDQPLPMGVVGFLARKAAL